MSKAFFFTPQSINIEYFNTITNIYYSGEQIYRKETNMALHLRVVDHMAKVRSMKGIPLIVNDEDINTEEGRDRLQAKITLSYESDTIENIYRCECGITTTASNEGVVCENCNTPVRYPLHETIETKLWLKKPKGMEALINPVVWTVLSQYFTSNRVNYLEWFANAGYRPPENKEALVTRLFQLGVDRGWNSFVKNFDDIVEFLFSLKIKTSGSKAYRERDEGEIREFIRLNRDRIFTDYLPLPNKLMFVKEKTFSGFYADPAQKLCMSAIHTLCRVDNELLISSPIVRQNRTFSACQQLADYYAETYSNILGRKEGMFRKHVYGSRLNHTARAVITSLSAQHQYDELHIPWGLAIGLFKVDLQSKLLRRGYSPREIMAKIIKAVKQYDSEIDSLLKELIQEAPWKGIPCLLARNPTLHRLSGQLLFITKVKTDVSDNTIGMSVLILKGPNFCIYSKRSTYNM